VSGERSRVNSNGLQPPGRIWIVLKATKINVMIGFAPEEQNVGSNGF